MTQQPNIAKSSFIDPPNELTQTGPEGIRFDFNFGCRVTLPQVAEEKWRLRFFDLETHTVVFDVTTEGGTYRSTKVFFVPFRIECWRGERLVFAHNYAAQDKPVLIQIPGGTLGDALAWFPYVDMFQRKHGCKLTCIASETARSLLEPAYPKIRFVNPEEGKLFQESCYATYCLGLFFDDWHCTYQPVDFRYVGLHKTAAYILGVTPDEVRPKVHIADTALNISEPYVCIATQSTTQSKYWNNPYGWREIVAWLKDCGYRVICIDKDATYGQGLVWNHLPYGAENMTGAQPLPERAALLKNAAFFVGLSSGLSWLAWAVETPVVMISGFTHPNNEFHTPYRVFNHHTCNSCWNDPKLMFDHADFLWCPRHKATDRQYECTRLIAPDYVKSVIRKIPGFLGDGGDQVVNNKP